MACCNRGFSAAFCQTEQRPPNFPLLIPVPQGNQLISKCSVGSFPGSTKASRNARPLHKDCVFSPIDSKSGKGRKQTEAFPKSGRDAGRWAARFPLLLLPGCNRPAPKPNRQSGVRWSEYGNLRPPQTESAGLSARLPTESETGTHRPADEHGILFKIVHLPAAFIYQCQKSGFPGTCFLGIDGQRFSRRQRQEPVPLSVFRHTGCRIQPGRESQSPAHGHKSELQRK